MGTIKIIVVLAASGILWSNAMAKTSIIALMPPDAQFQTVLAGIRSELDTTYQIDVIDMSKPLKTEEVAGQCRKKGTTALIVMDRQAIKTVQELQKFDSSFIAIPKFVFMTLMIEASTKGLSNVAGIRFEVPIYTLVTNFRIISQKDFVKVGVFHRKAYTRSIEEAQKLLSKEQISLTTVCIDCEKNEKTTPQDALSVMKKSFDKMVKEQNAEAVLALADNLIVNNTSLGKFWIGKVKKKKMPVIAPLDMLASPAIALAIFTADPDLQQLGVQAASQITEFFENETSLTDIGFESTISVKSTVNETVAKEMGWKLKAEKMGRINKIIK